MPASVEARRKDRHSTVLTMYSHADERCFWTHVDKSGDCWLWTGGQNGKGYGQFWTRGCRLGSAHRFAWLVSRGEIPAGRNVCHRCDIPLCVNPAHLFLGSQRDNLLDAIRKGRKRAYGLQKINAEQARAVRLRCAHGEPQRAVAAAFGISREHVNQIVNRKRWAHLDEATC